MDIKFNVLDPFKAIEVSLKFEEIKINIVIKLLEGITKEDIEKSENKAEENKDLNESLRNHLRRINELQSEFNAEIKSLVNSPLKEWFKNGNTLV